MCSLLFYTKSADHQYVYNYGFFSKNLAPVSFEETVVQMNYRTDKCSNAKHICIERHIPVNVVTADVEIDWKRFDKDKDYYAESSSEWVLLHYNDETHKVQETVKDTYIIYRKAFAQVAPIFKRWLTLDADLACYVFQVFVASARFRKWFVRQVRRLKEFICIRTDSVPNCKCPENEKFADWTLYIPFALEITVQWPRQRLYITWCFRLEGLVKKRMLLEETMIWLSTLGGAYSSLGEYFHHHAEEAGKISVQQLKIAIDMGDPIVAARCRLFYAQSLMQRGHLRDAKLLIRSQYHFVLTHLLRDEKLILICKALWSRLQYLYSRKNVNRAQEYHSSKK